MIYPWKLNYWQTGEWQVCNERLKDMEKAGIIYNPARGSLFRALSNTRPEEVKVCIIGQDPYPDHRLATGYAFSIPGSIPRESFPPTLNIILREYSSDLGYQFPSSGCLSRWVSEGVLLWNAIPSCTAGKSLSHDWDEYSYLTREIIQRLSKKGIVFAFCGSVAKRYLEEVDTNKNEVIVTSHPSPRGNMNSSRPFTGSRLFSTINDKLVGLGLEPVDWRLDETSRSEGKRPRSEVLARPRADGSVPKILQNETGSSCGPLLDARGVCIRQ